MIRTVYVITDARRRRARAVRAAVALVAARIVFLVAVAGHTVAQLAGAVDAYVTARLGVPRLAVTLRRARAALQDSWKVDL